jgi:hypothetical protein
MRNRWPIIVILLGGCVPWQTVPEEPATQQVSSMPFAGPGRPATSLSVNYVPAAKETADRVQMVRDKLIGQFEACGLRPSVNAVAAADPEIFHISLNRIFITEGLVKQCPTDGLLAAVLANEIGRMVAEREAAVSDEVRQPEHMPPIGLPIGSNGNSRDRDPINYIELAKYEKTYPKQTKKPPLPNPQLVARELLEHRGFQATDLDAALPILENAARFQTLENQFKGITLQGDWKQPK